MPSLTIDTSASPRLFTAQVKAWSHQVVGEVVDRSLEKAATLREEAAAARAQREAQEERAAAREAADLRRREELEARDAERLAELRRAQLRSVEAKTTALAA